MCISRDLAALRKPSRCREVSQSTHEVWLGALSAATLVSALVSVSVSGVTMADATVLASITT